MHQKVNKIIEMLPKDAFEDDTKSINPAHFEDFKQADFDELVLEMKKRHWGWLSSSIFSVTFGFSRKDFP